MPTSANFYVSPLSASNINNFGVDVGIIAAQQGGGTGLIYVAVSDNLEGQGVVGNPIKTKDNIQVVSLTTTNGATINTNLSASTATISGITANNVNSTTVSATTVSATSVTASLKGDGSQIINITASNIPNWTTDVRSQLSGSQYVTYNNGIGVISLPYTGSIIGTTPLILGQTASAVTGLTSISASLGTFTTLTASSFNLGTLSALTTSTGDLTVNNLIVNGVIENAAGAIQYITASNYQIIPSTSLVKISAPSGNITLNTSFPTIKTTGYNEGTRVFIVNIGSNVVTFKDDGAVTGTKLRMANQTYNQPVWGCIQFVLVSGSTGKTWVEAGRGA